LICIKDLEGSVDVFFEVHVSCAGGQKLHVVTLPTLPTPSPRKVWGSGSKFPCILDIGMELSNELCASATLIMMKVFQVEKLVGENATWKT
jgi:hypothetical protein